MRILQTLTRTLRSWICLEGSLSMMMPPGIDQPGLAGSDLMTSILLPERC